MNRHVSLLLLAALLAAGCVVYRYWAEEPLDKSWPAAGITDVGIRLDNGAILVRPGADSVILAHIVKSCNGTSVTEAESHLADITIGDSVAGNALHMWADIPLGGARTYNTEYELKAPPACGLYLMTANGAVEVDSMAGVVSVGATNGAVRIGAHDGSPSVEATNGAIDCDLVALDSAGTADLHSANGRVTLYLPADVSVAFDISTANGTANVTGFTNVSYTRNEGSHKTGTIGTGFATATLRSENGSVTIQAR